MANELSYRDRKVTAQPAEGKTIAPAPWPAQLYSECPRAGAHAGLDAAGVSAAGSGPYPEVYDRDSFRESMVLTLPHPTLGDLDLPGSGLGADQDDVFADYIRAGNAR